MQPISLNKIKTDFDFTTDCIYWDGFWYDDSVFGSGKNDPDSASKTLKKYHQALWSKELPNGDLLQLEFGDPYDYLNAQNGLRLSSDTIVTSFMHGKMRGVLEEAAKQVDWRPWLENILRQFYTIGGTILFPRHTRSLNGQRGMNPFICDRWDLTLECIRRYYEGIIDRENNPLGWVLETDKPFFNLLVDFRGYCDFFFLRDCVSEDYKSVKMWLPTEPFTKYPYPATAEEYFNWIEQCLTFVKNRNKRIDNYIAMRISL